MLVGFLVCQAIAFGVAACLGQMGYGVTAMIAWPVLAVGLPLGLAAIIGT